MPKFVNVFKKLLNKKKKKKGEALLFFWFFKNCELFRNYSLRRSNFIHLVCDSIVIIGLRSVYTFGSRFIYKRCVRILLKIWILAFLGKYSNIFVGSQSMSIEVRNIFQYFCCVSKRVYWGLHQLYILKI